jgi:DNA-binding protein YbaB
MTHCDELLACGRRSINGCGNSGREGGRAVADFGGVGDGLERILRDAESGMPKVGQMRERIGELVGKGEAADGRITAEFTSVGGLSALELDPRVLRLPAAELGQEIRTAVNTAAKDFQEQLTRVSGDLFGGANSSGGPRGPQDAKPFQDPAAALGRLEKMGDAFAGQMKELLRELSVQQQRAREAAERYHDLGRGSS